MRAWWMRRFSRAANSRVLKQSQQCDRIAARGPQQLRAELKQDHVDGRFAQISSRALQHVVLVTLGVNFEHVDARWFMCEHVA